MDATTRPRRPVSDLNQSPGSLTGVPGVLRPESRPGLSEPTPVRPLETVATDGDRRGAAFLKLGKLARERPDLYADPGYDSAMLPSLAFLHHKRVDSARQALLAE